MLTLSEVVAQRAATKLDVSVWSRLAVVSVIGLNGTLVTVLEADDDLGVVSTTEGGTDRHPRALPFPQPRLRRSVLRRVV